jgi:hypothetical protein
MKKLKIILPLVVIFFILIFLLNSSPPEKDVINISNDYTFETPENYLIGEMGENKLIQNNNLGFSFYVPKEWEIKGLKEDFVSGITFLSPDYKEDENFFIKDGCKTIVTVYKEEGEYGYLKEEIDFSEETTVFIEINGHMGKIIGENPHLKNIKVPLNENIYSFEGYFSENQRDYCKEAYSNLINSISFKNEK